MFLLVEGFSRERKEIGYKIFEGWNFLDLIFLLLFKVDVYSREEFNERSLSFFFGIKEVVYFNVV